MERIRVAHVINDMDVGGAQTQVLNLVRALDGPGYEQRIICLQKIGKLGMELRGEGFMVEETGKSARVDFAFFRRLRRLLRSFRPHILHSSVFTANLWGRLAALTVHVPVCITHEQSTVSLERLHRRLIDRILLAKTYRVLAVSEDLKQRLIAEEKLPEEKVQVLYNAIDCKALQVAASTSPGPLPGVDGKRVCIVGRLEYRKDHATLLRAAARVLEHEKDAHFLLVGDGPERSALETLTEELGLGEHVHFLGTRRDVPAILRATDVYCLSSITEGLSLSILEAMALEKAIVATRVGGNPELLAEGEAGFLAPARNPEALAEGLIDTIGNPEKAKRLAKNARVRAETLFDIHPVAERLSDIYHEALREKELLGE